MQRRAVATSAKIASTSTAPPNLKIYSSRKPSFKPSSEESSSWKASQHPLSESALTAFAHRIGLGAVLQSPTEIQMACTHPSYSILHVQNAPSRAPPSTNGNLAVLGNSLLGLFASEHIHAAYPHLPTRVIKAAVSAHVGPMTCASVAREMGASSLLRWHRIPQTPTRPAVFHTDALASIPRALTALVYQHRSLPLARKFVEAFFLSREVDFRTMIKFQDPKRALSETVRKFNRERPISRLLKETGRYSNSPIFVVGIYSGTEKLGEGFGSSLKMAEYRAAEDSLHRLYLTRQPSHLLKIPTSTFSSEHGDIFQNQDKASQDYVPGDLGESEVVFGSSGRTGIIMSAPQSSEGGTEEEQSII